LPPVRRKTIDSFSGFNFRAKEQLSSIRGCRKIYGIFFALLKAPESNFFPDSAKPAASQTYQPGSIF